MYLCNFSFAFLQVLPIHIFFITFISECLRDAETHLAVCIGSHIEERRRGRAAIRLQTALVAAQDVGDEKLQVVQLLQDLIDNKQRSLDADRKKLCKYEIYQSFKYKFHYNITIFYH